MSVGTPLAPSETETARAFVLAQLAKYSAYHDHKEKSAFTAAALFVGGAFTWFLTEAFWERPRSAREWCAILIIECGIAIATLIFVGWQLWKRAEAAVVVAGCHDAAADWIANVPMRDDVSSEPFRGRRWPRGLVRRFRGVCCAELRSVAPASIFVLLLIAILAALLTVKIWNAWVTGEC